MNGNNPTTRNQIMILLRKKGPLNAQELAKALGITDIAVRRHLNVLERDRLITAETVRQAMGRPTLVYKLTEQAEETFPKNYADISLDLLNVVRELHGEQSIEALFDRRESKLERLYSERLAGAESLETLVQQLAALQEERGYMAEWEKDEAGRRYLLVEHNCPIHRVANTYNQACSSELSLFRKVLQADVEQLECKAKGGERCIYAIKELAR